MRLSTVLGVTALGGLLGATAVLVPLAAQTPGSAVGWIASLATDLAKPDPERDAGATTKSTPSDVTLSSTATSPAKPQAAAAQNPSVKAAVAPWSAHVSVPETTAPVRMTSSRVATDEQRVKLGREIQQQLKRVGCYDGALDGEWNAVTKSGMSAFLDKVNATLPYRDPDYILLTLVQGHRGAACAAACADGQMASSSGRCQPTSVQAQAKDAPAKGKVAATAAVPVAAGLATAAVGAAGLGVATTGSIGPVPANRPTAKVEPVMPLPVAPIITGTKATAAAPQPKEPLPGRMSIGGPIPPALAQSAITAGAPDDGVRRTTKVTEPKPVETRVAKADRGNATDSDVYQPSAPVTASAVAPRSVARPQSAPDREAAPRRTVTILRPAPVYVAPPRRQASTAAQRQRRLVYDLFQNPARN